MVGMTHVVISLTDFGLLSPAMAAVRVHPGRRRQHFA
jgi:hypothetical protein